MYARLVLFEMPPGHRDLVEDVAERWSAGVATLPGFVNAVFFMDDDAGEYGFFSVWESKEDAESVPEQFGPLSIRDTMERLMTKPATIKIFDVYESRTLKRT